MATKEQEAFGSMGVFMGVVAKEGTGNVKWQQRKKHKENSGLQRI